MMERRGFRLRDVVVGDLEWVRRLNNASVPAMGPLGPAEVEWFRANAERFRVVETPARERVGFLIGLLPGHPYASENYRWFEANSRKWAYVDRVITEPAFRSRGAGRLLYDDFFAFAVETGAERVVCEVNVRPRNEGSLRFHDRMGFRTVGRAVTGGGEKEVVRLELAL